MSHIHDQIRAVVSKAEARAMKVYRKKLAAEEERHGSRLVEIDSELQGELEVARSALALIPKEDDAPEPPTPEEDDPDMVNVPAALQRPYAPSDRLVGKSRT